MPLAWPEGEPGLYKLRLRTVYNGKNCDNEFWYYSEDLGATCAVLVTAFQVQLLPDICNVVSEVITEWSIRCTNMGDPTDISIDTIATPGTRIGTPMARFIAWNFRFNSPNRLINSGGKRFVGVSEADSQDYGAPTSGINTLLVGLAGALAAPLGYTTGNFTPIIISPANTRHASNMYTQFDSVDFTKQGHQSSR